jgi:hypothetical protein
VDPSPSKAAWTVSTVGLDTVQMSSTAATAATGTVDTTRRRRRRCRMRVPDPSLNTNLRSSAGVTDYASNA